MFVTKQFSVKLRQEYTYGWNISVKFYTMMWMLCTLWLNVAPWSIRVQIHGRCHFLCFVQHGAQFWKCLWDYFRLTQVKSLKKVQQELFTREKNGGMGTKRGLDYFRTPKLQEIFTTAAIVFHLYERFAILQNVFAIILLWARKDVENFSKKLHTIKIKKKIRSRDEK